MTYEQVYIHFAKRYHHNSYHSSCVALWDLPFIYYYHYNYCYYHYHYSIVFGYAMRHASCHMQYSVFLASQIVGNDTHPTSAHVRLYLHVSGWHPSLQLKTFIIKNFCINSNGKYQDQNNMHMNYAEQTRIYSYKYIYELLKTECIAFWRMIMDYHVGDASLDCIQARKSYYMNGCGIVSHKFASFISYIYI